VAEFYAHLSSEIDNVTTSESQQFVLCLSPLISIHLSLGYAVWSVIRACDSARSQSWWRLSRYFLFYLVFPYGVFPSKPLIVTHVGLSRKRNSSEIGAANQQVSPGPGVYLDRIRTS
jgi:hypothetical protein